MKTIFHIQYGIFACRTSRRFSIYLFILLFPAIAHAQAISGIITDYNGFWKSTSASPNPVKPDNSHNLLAFTYNGQQYSTGVNDALLTARGETYLAGDFWSLPVGNISGALTSNTKVGFGALFDGVFNGPSSPAPDYGISEYLTDGIKGLNLGTCIANLPVGTMTLSISNIQPSSIGDGIPDIVVTQIADPSGSSDRYELTDANSVRVGNFKDIVFTNITPVGNWTADFYEALHNPLVLTTGFTQTDRPLRLWAADLSEFGITAANYSQIKNFKINLSGNSDVAFVAYNNRSFSFQTALPVQYGYFKGSMNGKTVTLDWETVSEQNAAAFIIERSSDGISFEAIGNISATNKAIEANDYRFIDRSPMSGKNFYRLKQVDINGKYTNSHIIRVENGNSSMKLQAYPNPAKGFIYAQYNMPAATAIITIYNSAGIALKQQEIAANSVQTKIDIQPLPAGSYLLEYRNERGKTVVPFVVNSSSL